MTKVWLTSSFQKEIFEKCGVTSPIQMVRQGIGVSVWSNHSLTDDNGTTSGKLMWEDINAEDHQDKFDYKFLSMCIWEEHKVCNILLEAIFKAFTPLTNGNYTSTCLVIVNLTYHDDKSQTSTDLE